jgi:hypothetical protein
MKTTFLILIGAFTFQSSLANECKNRERFHGPNVAFGMTFWQEVSEGAGSVDDCIASARGQLGKTIECDAFENFPQGCTVFAADYHYTQADGTVTKGRVR